MCSIESVLRRIDGRGYSAYKELRGCREDVDGIRVEVVRVQGDPYAPPSVVRLTTRLKLPEWAYAVPTADYLYRVLYRELRGSSRRLGEGRSGLLAVPKPSNAILRRGGLEVDGGRLVARVWVGLPSRRRRVLGDAAESILLETLPRVLRRVVEAARDSQLRRHVDAWVEQEYLRRWLREAEAAAFIGDGSVLPRRCSGCEEPLPDAVPFESPSSLRVEVELPTGRVVSGARIPKGFTVIAGSAFQGKTTLLEAIAAGVYDHVPGDGRELVVSPRSTMIIRSEDGRYVSCVDVSTFVEGIGDTRCFTTLDASGATSAAASIQEAVEAGSPLLLLDEDYVAVNILYRDEVAEELTRVHTVHPVTSQARSLTRYTSIILASYGTAPAVRVADKVIVMEWYKARDATEDARRLAGSASDSREYKPPKPRRLVAKPKLVKPKVEAGILRDKSLPAPVNLQNPHIVEEAQYTTLMKLLARVEEGLTAAEIAAKLEEKLERGGLKALLGSEPSPGDVEVRGIDVVWALNRIPGARFIH